MTTTNDEAARMFTAKYYYEKLTKDANDNIKEGGRVLMIGVEDALEIAQLLAAQQVGRDQAVREAFDAGWKARDALRPYTAQTNEEMLASDYQAYLATQQEDKG